MSQKMSSHRSNSTARPAGLLFATLCLLILAGGIGCSALGTKETPATAKLAILGVAGDYISSIARNDERNIDSILLWDEFRESKGPSMTHEYFQRQINSMQNRWQPNAHPLLNLDVVDLSVEGDYATVVLQKFEQPESPKITVVLRWVGRGWMVTNDSLFGQDGLIQKFVSVDFDKRSTVQ